MFDFLLLSLIFNNGQLWRLVLEFKLFFNIRLDDEFVYLVLHLKQVVEMLELVVELFVISEKR